MSPIFATIRFGPFPTAYHQSALNDEFRQALDAYLSGELLPQVDEPFESTAGTLTAYVNEEKFCGPHSLVKDIYIFDFAFIRPGSSDHISAEIRRNPKTGRFETRYNRQPLYLWTSKRRVADQAFRSAIDGIVKRIGGGQTEQWSCPRCGSILRLTDSLSLFDLSCGRGCFAYNFHRDLSTGEFQHGHFFSQPPMPVPRET